MKCHGMAGWTVPVSGAPKPHDEIAGRNTTKLKLKARHSQCRTLSARTRQARDETGGRQDGDSAAEASCEYREAPLAATRPEADHTQPRSEQAPRY